MQRFENNLSNAKRLSRNLSNERLQLRRLSKSDLTTSIIEVCFIWALLKDDVAIIIPLAAEADIKESVAAQVIQETTEFTAQELETVKLLQITRKGTTARPNHHLDIINAVKTDQVGQITRGFVRLRSSTEIE
jgi:hypothetical protein